MTTSSTGHHAARASLTAVAAVAFVGLPVVGIACDGSLSDCYKQASKLHYHGSKSDNDRASADRIQRETDRWANDVSRRVDRDWNS